MTTSSVFTEVIEDHLALKKQNAQLEAVMPLAQFDVGDPLDRYPGGPVRPAAGADAESVAVADPAATGLIGDPVAMADEAFPPAMEPLNGMAPMLSLVEDLDDDSSVSMLGAPAVAPAPEADVTAVADVVRFPGGAGPRVDDAVATVDAAERTGEQPVIVIDADEPLAPVGSPMQAPQRMSGDRKRPTFFGLRRKKKDAEEPVGSGWFSSAPRDFDWD